MRVFKNYQAKTGVVAAFVALSVGLSSVQAVNITINDGLGSGGSGTGGEVGETEPGTVNNHYWDNEAFVIKGNKLVLIGGFDYLNGYGGFAAGDIFLNTAGAMPIGTALGGANGYRTISGNLGYEYVLDLNVAAGKFNVVNIAAGANVSLQSGYYRQNDLGNPFAYLAGGTTDYADQNLVFRSGLTTAQIQADYGADVVTSGDGNFVLELDMSWWNLAFPNGGDLISHFTLGCANDVIAGQVSGGFDHVPDGGATLVLLGLGMSGLALAGRRITRKS